MILLPLKFQSFRIAVMYIHLFFLKHKSLSFADLSLFFHEVLMLWLEPNALVLILYILPKT